MEHENAIEVCIKAIKYNWNKSPQPYKNYLSDALAVNYKEDEIFGQSVIIRSIELIGLGSPEIHSYEKITRCISSKSTVDDANKPFKKSTETGFCQGSNRIINLLNSLAL